MSDGLIYVLLQDNVTFNKHFSSMQLNFNQMKKTMLVYIFIYFHISISCMTAPVDILHLAKNSLHVLCTLRTET